MAAVRVAVQAVVRGAETVAARVEAATAAAVMVEVATEVEAREAEEGEAEEAAASRSSIEVANDVPLDSAPDPSGDAPSPEAAARKREEAERLQEALAELPEDEREILLLRQVEGLTFREVCDVTGLSRDAVRWRLARGMERLREALAGTIS